MSPIPAPESAPHRHSTQDGPHSTLTAEEPRRNIPRRRTAPAQVDNVRHDPPAERDLGADVDEDEEREEVHVAQAHDLLVLVPARPVAVALVRARGDADRRQEGFGS